MMHLRIAGIHCLAIFAVCTSAAAKPRSVQIDAAFDDCDWAAEVTIVSVGDQIRVRVSEDADAIYRGHVLMGKILDVQPCPGGPTSCRVDLLRLTDGRTRVLMVVAQDGSIVLVGAPQKVDGESGYRARSWCDWNAVWFYAKEKSFGKTVGDAMDGVYDVTHKQIAARFADERAALMLSLASVLLRPRVDLPEANIKATIAQLGDDDFRVREAAQRELTRLGEGAVPLLHRQASLATDPEIAARLRATVRDLQSPLLRHALAIREKGSAHEAKVLIAAHDAAKSKEDRRAIVARLRALANHTERTSDGDVINAWRQRSAPD